MPSPSKIGATARRWTGVLLLAWGLTSAHAVAAADNLTYLVHEPADKSAHPPLIVLLHGSGADERDMIGLWPQLPGSFVVLSPRAPFPDAGGGYRWYRKGASGEADREVSRKIIDDLIDDAVRRFAVDPGKVFLAGFSQGAVMVYETALREPGRFRGAAVLSGSMFASERAKLSGGTGLGREAFFVAHGTADPRIPFRDAIAARATLAKLGVPTDFHAYSGMGHTVGDAETRDLGAWLSERIASDDAAPR